MGKTWTVNYDIFLLFVLIFFKFTIRICYRLRNYDHLTWANQEIFRGGVNQGKQEILSATRSV